MKVHFDLDANGEALVSNTTLPRKTDPVENYTAYCEQCPLHTECTPTIERLRGGLIQVTGDKITDANCRLVVL